MKIEKSNSLRFSETLNFNRYWLCVFFGNNFYIHTLDVNRRAHIEFKNFQSNIARCALPLRMGTKEVSEFYQDFPISHLITNQFRVTN